MSEIPHSLQSYLTSLKDKFPKGEITKQEWRKYWKYCVPEVFNPSPEAIELHSNKSIRNQVLFAPLIEYLYGCERSTTSKFETKLPKPSTKMKCQCFTYGNAPAFSCPKCALLSEAKLCRKCFVNSKHINHEYKIITSPGAGCCDCGNVLAWKGDPSCKIHEANTSNEQECRVQNEQQVTENLVHRARVLFECVFEYATQLLPLSMEKQLPEDLCLLDEERHGGLAENTHCFVLRSETGAICNETSVMEVIHTLTGELKIFKDDLSYTRAILMCSSLDNCYTLKRNLDIVIRDCNELKIIILEASAAFHQTFALELLQWIEKLLKREQILSKVFSEVILTTLPGEQCLAQRMLQMDHLVWEEVRLVYLSLFTCNVFIELEEKRQFARVLAHNYCTLQNNFICGEYPYSTSCLSLGKILFSEPTLAHEFISNEALLEKAMNTFQIQCFQVQNEHGYFGFDLTKPPKKLRRAYNILDDLKSLLATKPLEWTNALEHSFISGMKPFVSILSALQEVDLNQGEIRKYLLLCQNFEEPFDLERTLADLAAQATEWCSTNCTVFIKTMQAVNVELRNTMSLYSLQRVDDINIAGHFAAPVIYASGSFNFSLHIPLMRFLARLWIYMPNFQLNINSREFMQRPHPHPEEILEVLLRIQSTRVQIHTKTWMGYFKRLPDQLAMYQSNKSWTFMFDMDIVLLQILATVIEPNEFLIHILSKFQLIEWAQINKSMLTEDSLKYETVTLVDELLTFLIQIFGERYVPGIGDITEDDCIKHSVIQHLSIRSLTHSELNLALSANGQFEENMNRVIDQVSVFKEPLGTSPGRYELKEQYYDQVNIYYYHFDLEQIAIAEERKLNRQRSTGGTMCCIPPLPPQFTSSFQSIVNVMECDVAMHLLCLILRDITNDSNSHAAQQLQKVLYLIGLALFEQENNSIFRSFTHQAQQYGILDMLKKIHSKTQDHQDFLYWVIIKFELLESNSSNNFVPFLHDQLLSDSNAKHEREMEKEKRRQLAEKLRTRILTEMKAKQEQFIASNKWLEEEVNLESVTGSTTEAVASTSMANSPTSMQDTSGEAPQSAVALGPRQSLRKPLPHTQSCIVCQQEQRIGDAEGKGPLGMLCLVQTSNVLKRRHHCDRTDYNENPVYPNPFLPFSLVPSPYISSCGHIVHLICLQKNLIERYGGCKQLPSSTLLPCPLCCQVFNTVMPLVPTPKDEFVKKTSCTRVNNLMLSMEGWIEGLKVALHYRQPGPKSSDTVAPPGNPDTLSISVPTAPVATQGDTPTSRMNADLTPPPVTPVTSSSESEEGKTSSDTENSSDENIFMPRLNLFRKSHEFQISNGDSYSIFLRISSVLGNDGAAKTLLKTPNTQFITCTMETAVKALGRQGSRFFALFPTGKSPGSALPQVIHDQLFLFALDVNKASSEKKDSAVKKDCAHGLLAVWKACAYTIHALENTLRYNAQPLMDTLPTYQKNFLHNYVTLSGILGIAWPHPDIVSSCALDILSVLLESPETRPCILEWDSLSMMISLNFSVSNLFLKKQVPPYTVSKMHCHFILKLIFAADIIKAILSYENQDISEVDEEGNTTNVCEISNFKHQLSQLLHTVYEMMNLSQEPTSKPTGHQLWMYVCHSTIPFLRSSSLLYHLLFNVTPPKELNEQGGDTLEKLCSYLDLSPVQILQSPFVVDLIQIWCSHPKVKLLVSQKAKGKRMTYLPDTINQLINLPENYSKLISLVPVTSCTYAASSCKPILCLICGEFISYINTQYNSVLSPGEGDTYLSHANKCGVGYGLFLNVWACEVFLVTSSQLRKIIAGPYVDKYGEQDQGLKRGKSLILSKAHYKMINKLWMNHELLQYLAKKSCK